MAGLRKPAQDRKAQIVQTAIWLAGEVGPDRLTTNMLAKEIGISQPAIFRHFPTKGAIWQAVAEHIGKFMRVGGEIIDPTLSPTMQLQNMVSNHLGTISKNPAIPAILFSRELHAENDVLRQHFARVMQNRQAVFAELMARGVQKGEFAESLNIDDAAYLVLALIQGLAMRWSLSGHSFELVAEGGRLMEMQISGFKI